MFSASEHSRIFLVSPEPRNDWVISWIWDKVMQGSEIWRKNFLDSVSLQEGRVVRFAADNIAMYGMRRETIKIMWMAWLRSVQFVTWSGHNATLEHSTRVLDV